MRSAYDLRQNLVGVGILWSYGYYNQIRAEDGSMATQYMRKNYPFLEDHNIKFLIHVCGSPVWVKAYFLNPETFGTDDLPRLLQARDMAAEIPYLFARKIAGDLDIARYRETFLR